MLKKETLLRIVLPATIVLIVLFALTLYLMTSMPLRSYAGTLPPLDTKQQEIRDALHYHVANLTLSAERSIANGPALVAAADYVIQRLQGYDYEARSASYRVGGTTVSNLIAEKRGAQKPDEVVVIGAHYDSARGSPGANDNASGVAALIELSYLFKDAKPGRSVQFVFFPNEEPPYFQTNEMGSVVYAHWLRRNNVDVVAMLSLETIGYYSDAADSQRYPAGLNPMYGNKADFIGFVGNFSSRALTRRVTKSFREHARFPSEGMVGPSWLDGVGWSDHWAFWQEGYPAVMVTDTALFRYPYYHRQEDTLDKLDFERMATVVSGLQGVILDLATVKPSQ